METYDAAVIGAGFGGLGAALELNRAGKSVVLFERLTYPGGCASTFRRRGYAFESGATLFSGFGDGRLFDRLMSELDLDLKFVPLYPVVEMRLGDIEIDVSSDRERFVNDFVALCDAPDKVRRFFAFQKEIADILWPVLDRPDLLPPLSWGALATHAKHSLAYTRLVRWIGRPLSAVLDHFGVGDETVLRHYLDAVCQITVQAPTDRAEALFALGATDYFFRGTGHIHGGIGELATAILDALRERGVDVRLADEVKSLRREGSAWRVASRRGEIEATDVVANLLPTVVDRIADADSPALAKLSEKVDDGWGAAMLYLMLDDAPHLPDHPFHLQLVADLDSPFQHGNHVFVSVCARDEIPLRSKDGRRTATVSTHLDVSQLRQTPKEAHGELVASVQQRMRETIQLRAPAVWQQVADEMTASPRTWERFTARPGGLVGGVPRNASLTHYLGLKQRTYAPHLRLVGDSVFPGQSVMATFVGGQCTARAIS
jgi:phytoene dehydrogenase-like protein